MSFIESNFSVGFIVNEHGQKIARKKYFRVDDNFGLNRPDLEFHLLDLFKDTDLFPQPVRQYNDNGHLVVEMECCGHDLVQQRNYVAPTFSPVVARDCFRQLLNAVHEMHSRDYAHCDIKPENVLIDPATNKIVLCDLGQALKKDQIARGPRGSNGYRAPEMLQPSEYDAFRADMFSLGQVLFYMLTGQNLYNHAANPMIPPFAIKRAYADAGGVWMRTRLSHASYQLDSDAVDLLVGLFAPAENRFTLEQVLAHAWMNADPAM